jgi:hypothetical protein
MHMDTFKASVLFFPFLFVFICGCVSQSNEVVLQAALPPAPYSMFTRFPYYTYNQTIISDHMEFKGIPIDFIVVLSNHTPMPILVPSCENLWPNTVDIEMKTCSGSIHELKTKGVVSIRPTDKTATLVVPPGGSIAYPVVLDQHLFQNLPCLTLGDSFFIRAKISWSEMAKNDNSIDLSSTAVSRWIPLVYKANADNDQRFGKHSNGASEPRLAESLYKECDDKEITVNITFDEGE